MTTSSQLAGLIRQQLLPVLRNRYLRFTFLALPMMIWLMVGFQMLLVDSLLSTPTFGDKVIYISNEDVGNGTYKLGDELVRSLTEMTKNPSHPLFQASVEQYQLDVGYREAVVAGVSPLVLIPGNLTRLYSAFNLSSGEVPKVQIASETGDEKFAATVSSSLAELALNSFTQLEVRSQAVVLTSSLAVNGEEAATNPWFNSILQFLVVVLSAFAPAVYVSSAFSEEKRSRTLEGLLVLPVNRAAILFSKIGVGGVMVTIFSLSNTAGLVLLKQLAVLVDSDQLSAFTDLLTFRTIVAVSVLVLLSGLFAMGVGIAIVSRTTETQTAEILYVVTMVLPAVVILFLTLDHGLPTGILPYILPWYHIVAILTKLLYPGTYAYATFTPYPALDVLLHMLYLLVCGCISVVAAARSFDREGLIL